MGKQHKTADDQTIEQKTQADEAEHEELLEPAAEDNSTDAEEYMVSVDPLQQLQAELAEAEAKATDHWDRLLRLQAEMENLRKRGQRDIENAHKFSLEKIATELLGVRDGLEMGLDAAANEETDISKIREGTELTLKMLAQLMEKFNIEQIDPIGQKFDPDKHQALQMQEQEGADSNTVLVVIQKGYSLNDRLLRPALVTVAK